jgi:hypothetical protein
MPACLPVSCTHVRDARTRHALVICAIKEEGPEGPSVSTLCMSVLAANEVALLEAARADVHLLALAILHDGDMLDIGTELTVYGAV